MRIIKEFNHAPTGLVADRPSLSADHPFGTGIGCHYMGIYIGMMDVPPWGTVLPFVEGSEGALRYYIEAETLHMPKDSVLGIRWTPQSGNNIHTLSHTLPGDGQIKTGLLIPQQWLFEAQGEDVLIEYEVAYPDGSTGRGRSYDINVSRNLEFGKVTVGGLQDGEYLNPDNYPDGITVTIDPIVHVREYSKIRLFWEVRAYIGDTQYLFAEWFKSIPCVPGQAYDIVVPPEAYNGMQVPGFDRFEILVAPVVTLAPEPVPEFRFALGRTVLPVSFEVK
jgi:hypothetical protein